MERAISFIFNNQNTSTIGNFNGEQTNLTTNSFGVGVLPFFGVKYYITNRLSIGIETGFAATFTQAFNREDTLDFINGELTAFNKGETTRAAGNFRAFFSNLRFLNLGVNF